MLVALLQMGAAGTVSVGASAQSHLNYPPGAPPAILSECNDCHLIYPAQMLPQRSWQAILADLANHFGDDATVSNDKRTAILAYYSANATDGPSTTGRGKLFISGLPDSVTPLRITAMPWWNQMHADYDFGGGKHIDMKTASNCLACHSSDAQ